MWCVAAAALAAGPAATFDPFEADDAGAASAARTSTDRTARGYDPFEATDAVPTLADRSEEQTIDPFEAVDDETPQDVEPSAAVAEVPAEPPSSLGRLTEELAVEEPAPDEAAEELSAETVERSPLPAATQDEEGGLRAELVITESAGAGDSFAQTDSKDAETPWWQLQIEEQPPQPQPEATPEQIAQRREQIEKERAKAKEACEEIYREVRDDVISTVDLDIRLKGNPGEDYPFDCTLGSETFQPRNWSTITYRWKAAGLCHKPLYFQEVQLERYGHTWGPVLQPFVSGAHFFLTVPALPYAMGIQTPNECVYTLGYYRPGSCAPYMIEALPFTWRAAAFQGGVATGMAFIFP